MFLAVPFESPPAQRTVPWMTVLLILICCLVHWGFQRGDMPAAALLQGAEAGTFTAQVGYQLSSGSGLQFFQWLLAPWLHANSWQLMSNMLLVLIFGLSLEMMLGRAVFLGLYLIGGLLGTTVGALGLSGTQGLLMGATGSAACLAAAYAVYFQRRRMRFALWRGTRIWLMRWPAWVALPALPLLLLLQMLLTGRPSAISLMTLGGMLTGGGLMAARLHLQTRWPMPSALPPIMDTQPATLPGNLTEMVALASELAEKHEDMPRATLAWRAVARHSRNDSHVLLSWFECALHDPRGDDIHTAARYIFKLPDTPENQQLKHEVWVTYTKFARPATRLSDDTRHALARIFIGLGELGSAERICQSLLKRREHPMWPGTLSMLVDGLARSGQMEQARHWLPTLQRDAPQERVTQWLSLLP